MATTWTISTNFSDGAVGEYKTNSVSDDQNLSIDVSLTASQANKQYNCNIVASRMSGYYFSFIGDCTLFINNPSGSSPAATIYVKGGVPVFWTTDDHSSRNALSGLTLTNIYLTDTSAAVNTGVIKFLYDPTP